MIVISHHVKKIGMQYPKDAVIRINVAWVESKAELEVILKELKGHRIWLDYPTGRTKPPMPKFSLEEAIEFAKKYQIEYFAFSNAEDTKVIEEIRNKVPSHVLLVPKVETIKGVNNVRAILKSAKTNIIMLDQEDLYTDVKGNQHEFDRLVKQCRNECKSVGATCLELKGVVFGHE